MRHAEATHDVIIATADLPTLQRRVAMVDGGFDPIHTGHIEYFRVAAELGLPVLCNVVGDEYVATKHRPLLCDSDRVHVLDAIRYISYTHLSAVATSGVLEKLQPRFYVKGEDWRNRLPAKEQEICGRLGIEIVYTDTVIESSSRLLNAWRDESI
jgi:cytidyltransferase-like protein